MKAASHEGEMVHVIEGNSYKDRSTVIITPSRGLVHLQVIESWNRLLRPKNQKVAHIYAKGHEVGEAYNGLIEFILDHEVLSKCKYVMSLEDDNIPPPSALMRLLDCMEQTEFDAVGMLYYTKGDEPMPMAYGDVHRTGGKDDTMDFSPVDVSEAIMQGGLIEVNGIAMGCTIYRMDLFKQIEKPWFVTVNEWDTEAHKLLACGDPAKEKSLGRVMTQDLSFCLRARKAGKRFAVDCSNRVGHMDVETETVY